jgi:hypothetical protein
MYAGSNGRAVHGVGLDRLDAEVAGSNPAYGTDACPRLSMLRCSV